MKNKSIHQSIQFTAVRNSTQTTWILNPAPGVANHKSTRRKQMHIPRWGSDNWWGKSELGFNKELLKLTIPAKSYIGYLYQVRSQSDEWSVRKCVEKKKDRKQFIILGESHEEISHQVWDQSCEQCVRDIWELFDQSETRTNEILQWSTPLKWIRSEEFHEEWIHQM